MKSAYPRRLPTEPPRLPSPQVILADTVATPPKPAAVGDERAVDRVSLPWWPNR